MSSAWSSMARSARDPPSTKRPPAADRQARNTISRGVMVGNSEAFWNERTSPRRLRASGASRVMSSP